MLNLDEIGDSTNSVSVALSTSASSKNRSGRKNNSKRKKRIASSGIVIVDTARNLVSSCQQAQTILSRKRYAAVKNDGQFTILDAEGDAQIAKFLENLGDASMQALTIAIDSKDGSSFATYSLLAMAGNNMVTNHEQSEERRKNQLVFVKIKGCAESDRFCSDTFSKRYQLTPAEVSLAKQLFNGKSISEATAQLGLSIYTVRDRVKSIYAKTFTHNLTELVKLMYRFSH